MEVGEGHRAGVRVWLLTYIDHLPPSGHQPLSVMEAEEYLLFVFSGSRQRY